MVIDTSIKYNSNLLKADINALILRYPFINIITIGYSVLRTPIYCIKIGSGSKEIFYCAATHANEWITSSLLMKFTENLCIAYNKNTSIFGYNVKKILNSCTLYIVPMVNPDGVNLVNDKLNLNSREYAYARYIARKYPDIPFPSGWKSNIRGVDLKNYQPFCKVLHLFIYKTLLFFYFFSYLPF